MKHIVITLLALGFAVTSCDQPFMGQTSTDGVAPSPVTNARVTNLAGGALITYDLPDDEDLLYVKASYARNSRVTAANKASVYTDTLRIEGLGDTTSRIVEVVAVDRSGNVSEPLYVTIHPLTPLFHQVLATLTAEAALSGIQLTWTNEGALNLAITVIKWEKEKYVPVEVIYSSLKEGSYGVRKQKARETKFGIYIQDKWLNTSDTLFTTLTPVYEERVEGVSWYPMKTDGTPKWLDWGFKPEYLFDDTRTDGGFHTDGEDEKWPHHVTFKAPKSYKLSRFKIYQRFDSDWPFAAANPKKYELWGTNSRPEVNGTYDGWTKLGNFEAIKPSGSAYGTLTSEDREAAALGHEHLMPADVGEYEYYRLKVTETWSGTPHTHFKKIELYGIPEGFDPNAPVI